MSEALAQTVTNETLTREEARAIALKCFADPVEFCRFFLPHLFPGPIPWVHRGLLAILTGKVAFLLEYGELDKICRNFSWKDEDEKEHRIFEVVETEHGEPKVRMYLREFTLIMMPRGSSKTTIAGIAVPLYEILYEDTPFSVYVSEASAHSKMQLHNVQRELTDNVRVQAVFGHLRPKLRDDEKWSGDFFETKNGMAMAAKGRGGQIRGLNHRGHRPKKIIVDDPDDKESVATDEQRRKTIEWAYGDLMPALPKLDPTASIVAMGTKLHPQALLPTLQRDPRWQTVQIGVLDTDGDPIWPAYMDHAKIEQTKESYAASGLLHIFYMEYFNEVRAGEAQCFKQEYFRYDPEIDKLAHTAIYIDPAISPKRYADETAIVVGGITFRGLIVVLDVVMKRGMTEREKVDIYFDLSLRWKCDQHGVESQAYQAALVHLLREEMFRKKHYFEIEPITHKSKKTARIRSVLQPRFAAGYIVFRHRFPKLETQLLDFRTDTDDQPDDGPDALAGCVALLDPYAAQAAGDKDLAEDQYEPLDEAIGGDWRDAP